jgi:hypothetical protein
LAGDGSLIDQDALDAQALERDEADRGLPAAQVSAPRASQR